jgi:folate-dependent phosphoribosylglycinamide formyltransferase PurN
MRICWFTSGKDNQSFILFKDVLEAIDKKVIDGSISVVFINREKHESEPSDMLISYAESKSIPVETLSTRRFLTENNLSLSTGRSLYDAEVQRKIKPYTFDVIFLAGYMLIVSPVIFTAHNVLNIHASLPGGYKGRWDEVTNRLIDDQKKTFGAVVHLVEEILNEGPLVAYSRISVKGKEIGELYKKTKIGDRPARIRLFNIVREKEFEVERPLTIQTLSLISKGIITIKNGAIFHRGRRVKGGVDITTEVREWQSANA